MSQPLILCVDDEACITFMVSTKINATGARAVTASNGADAFEIAKKQPPALIITDFEMPRMNGLQFAQALKSNESTANVPVILLTARGHRVPPSDLASTNIVQLLSKPFSSRELMELIKEHVPALADGQPGQAAA